MAINYDSTQLTVRCRDAYPREYDKSFEVKKRTEYKQTINLHKHFDPLVPNTQIINVFHIF